MQPGQLEALLPRLPRLAVAMANSIQTDMSVDHAIGLARLVKDADLQDAARVVIDNKMGETVLDPTLGYMLVPDMAKLRSATDLVFASTPSGAGPAPEETVRQAVQDEAARLVVLNGTPERGLAAQAQTTLVAGGFNVVGVGNAETGDYVDSWLIVSAETAPATRDALMERFGIPDARVRIEQNDGASDLTLILGADQLGGETATFGG